MNTMDFSNVKKGLKLIFLMLAFMRIVSSVKLASWYELGILKGVFFETTDSQDLNHRNQQLNSFLRSITSSQVAIYIHRIRSDDREEIYADYCSHFGNDFAEKYMRLVANRDLKRTDLYLTLVYSPYINRAQRVAQKAAKRTTEQIKQDRLVSLEKMRELSNKVESSLRRYYPRLLKSYEKNGIEFNEQLSFMNFLLTFQWQEIRVLKKCSRCSCIGLFHVG